MIFLRTCSRRSCAGGTKADAQTDPAAKQAGYDDAAGYATKALALGHPTGMPDAMFTTIKTQGYPVLYGAVAADDLMKKDNAGAIAQYKKELAGCCRRTR